MSIQNQNFKDYEVWIIDSASSDGTIEYLQTLERPFHWISEPDNGVYDAMNKGISLSIGKWLYFLGADDILFNPSVLTSVFSKPIPDQTKMIIGKIKYNLAKDDPIFLRKNDGLVRPSWSKKLWIKNSLHHQALIYHRTLFIHQNYSVKYKILADYAFNLNLFKDKIIVKLTDEIIAFCGTKGQSKNYFWSLYQEEINLKVAASSPFLRPLFFLIGFAKYLIKKISS